MHWRLISKSGRIRFDKIVNNQLDLNFESYEIFLPNNEHYCRLPSVILHVHIYSYDTTEISACIFDNIWPYMTAVHMAYETFISHMNTILCVCMCLYQSRYVHIILLVSHMSLFVWNMHVTYLHVQAYMQWYGSSYLPVSACIHRNICMFSFSVLTHTGIYALIWQFVFACICLYVVCIYLYAVKITVASRSQRQYTCSQM